MRKGGFKLPFTAMGLFKEASTLWQVKPRPPPKATGQTKIAEYSIDLSLTQKAKSPILRPQKGVLITITITITITSPHHHLIGNVARVEI